MRSLVPLLTVLLVSAPSVAIDLTGVWEGGFKCKEFDGEKDSFKQADEILLITQVGSELLIEWVGAADLQGVAVDDIRKPDNKGVAALIDCETNTDFTSGYGEIGQLQVKIDREKGKGTLKGSGVYTADGDAIGTCKWKFSLVSLEDPGATGCD